MNFHPFERVSTERFQAAHPRFLRNMNITAISRNMSAEKQKREENMLYEAQQILGRNAK